jgi:hypothetical protein
MSLLVALKKLVLGETWLLPVGLATVVAVAALLARPLAPHLWQRLGGFLILAGVLAVVLASVARAARSRS